MQAISVANQPVVLTGSQGRTGHLRGDIFWHVLVSEAVLALPELLSVPGLRFQPLKNLQWFISPELPIMCSYFARRKSSGLDLLYLNSFPFRLFPSCRSGVVCVFALIDFSIILLTV